MGITIIGKWMLNNSINARGVNESVEIMRHATGAMCPARRGVCFIFRVSLTRPLRINR